METGGGSLSRSLSKQNQRARHPQSNAVNPLSIISPKESLRAIQKPVFNEILETATQDSNLGFDDPGNYGITTRNLNGEEGLLQIEIKTLIAEATSDDVLLTSEVFDAANQLSYEHISHIADQVLCNLAIVDHDNHVLIFRHCWEGRLVEFSAPLYLEARAILSRRYNLDDPKQMPQIIRPGETESNRGAYFALVDYLTSSIAHFMLTTAVSVELVKSAFAVLARWRIKLKAISYNPATYAEDALIFGEDAIRQSQSGSFKSRFQGLYNGANANTDLVQVALLDKIQKGLMELSDPTKNIGSKSLLATLYAAAARRTENFQGADEEDTLSYETGIHLRVHLALILKQVANGLYSDTTKGLVCFEAFTTAYEVGPEKSPTTFSGDRQGNIVTSSDASHLRISIPAFDLLNGNAKKICIAQSQSGPPRTETSFPNTHPAPKERNMASFTCVTPYKTTQQTIELVKAGDVVSILVPLALASPFVARETQSLILNFASSSKENEVIKQDGLTSRYYFRLQTAEYVRESQETQQKEQIDRSGAIPISSNPLGTNNSLMGGSNHRKLHTRAQDPRMQRNLAQNYLKYDEKMRHWVTNESSIVVECKPYIIFILFVSAIILLGGIAIGVTAGERIPGVDPWGITNYSWLVVGVVLVFAKSRYVTDWPWHDFLRMRVVCSSVSDLAEVGQVPEEIVLIKLLLEEHKTTLRTTGPYNGMFSRRAGQGEGFAIDVPVGINTMFAAGFIVLKVKGEEGDIIVVFDSRKRTEVQMMGPRGQSGEWLSCVGVGGKLSRGLEEASTAKKPRGPDNIFLLTRNEIKWSKVMGLFVEEASFG